MKQLKKLILPLLVALFVSSTGLYAAFAESSVKSVSYTVENVTSGISDENVTVTDLNGNEVNLAAGPHGGTGAKSVFTDGVISSTQTAMLVDGDGKGVIGYITVDAGAVYTVNRVLIDIVHDWGANDFTLELSETSDFENSRVVFSNKQGNAITADKSYNTSGTLMNVPYQGLTFNFSPVRARYIRVTGNTVGNGAEQGYTCIGEIQMYAITSGAPVWANAVSGRYNAFELAFGTESENAKIYYTLDGSAPNKNSTEYTGPIVLEKGEYRFRAVSYENGVYGYPFDFDYTVSGSIFNSVNIARGKTVTAYGLDGSVATPATLNGSDNIQSLTNGDKGLFDAFTFDKLAFVQVDLGESVWTDTVYLNLWNDWVFRQIVIQISDDENFENYTTLVNTGNYGNLDNAWVSGEYSVSPEFNEGEWKQHSADGWTFTFAPVKGRYVRATNQNGNGAGYFSVFTEMEVWTCEAPEATEYEIGVNIARGKTVTAYGLDGSEISVLDLNGGGTLGAVVDGTKGLFNSIQLDGLGWIQVDFGVSAWINRVDLTLWHDWVFREITVQVSDTEDFSTFTTILCTGNNGHTDNAWVGGEYTATPEIPAGEWKPHSGDGWSFAFAPVKGRYIRTFNQSGNGSYYTVLTEIQAYTCEEPTAEKEVKEFDFTEISGFEALSELSAGIDPNTENEQLGYTEASWVTYARELNQLFTLDNGLKTNTSAYSGNDVSDNTIYVRLNNKELRYYKSTMTYTLNSGNGWAGFVVNYTDYSRKGRWGDSPNGIEIFVQKEGKTTYSSSKLNNSGYTEVSAPDGWNVNAAHTLEMTVSESGISIVLDGIETLVLTAEILSSKGLEMVSATPTFFVSNTEFTVLSYSVEYDKPEIEYEYQYFVNSVVTPSEVEVYVNKDFADLGLPATVKVTYSDGSSADIAAQYVADNYDKTTAGEYEIPLVATDENDAYGLLENITVKVTVKAIDTSALEAAITAAEGADENAYTVSTYSALVSVKESADEVMSKTYKTQEEINSATAALESAFNALAARADLTAINGLIAAAEAVNGEEYTVSSYNALAEELAAAENFVSQGNADISEEEANVEYGKLNSAYNALVKRGDVTELAAYYDEVLATYGNDETDTHGYFIASYVSYVDAMEETAGIIADVENGDTDQATLDAALATLKAAVEALEPYADRTALAQAIENAEAAEKSSYTATSYNAMKEVYEQSEAVYEKNPEYLTQQEVDDATEQLNAALSALVALGNKEVLNQAISMYSGEAETDYTSASYAPYKEAEYVALAYKNSDDVTQEQVDKAAADLKAAFEGLVRSGDRDLLSQKINEALAHLETVTDETERANIQAAVDYARQMVDFEGDVTEEQVNGAIALIDEAIGTNSSDGSGSGCFAGFGYGGIAGIMIVAFALMIVKSRRLKKDLLIKIKRNEAEK